MRVFLLLLPYLFTSTLYIYYLHHTPSPPPPSLTRVCLKCLPILCLAVAVEINTHFLTNHSIHLLHRATAVGLLVSLVGDACLVYPQNATLFHVGSTCFALVHMIYVYTWGWGAVGGPLADLLLSSLLMLLNLLAFVSLWDGIGSVTLRLVVVAYAFTLYAFVWSAVTAVCRRLCPSTLLNLVGAVLFCVSDYVLGLSQWAHVPPAMAGREELCIISTYYTAQGMLTLSVLLLQVPHSLDHW